jgi:predicted SprT family Zn-dependent metalloprotease
MQLNDASLMAREIMNDHGLDNWNFGFDNARRRFGRCNHTHRLIGLSAPLVSINSKDEVRDVILHEVAHALAGHSAGHGPRWQEMCRRIGAKPERCYNPDEVNTLTAKWTGTCPVCANEFSRDRLSASLKRSGGWCPCTKVGNPETAIKWRQNH